jgi:hypothetical protein
VGDLDNDFDTTKRMHLYYAQLNIGVTDYVDVYTLIGTASMRSEYWAKDPTAWGETFEYGWVNNNPHGFLWGVGLKGTFFRLDNGLYLGTGVNFNEVRVYDVNYKEYRDGAQSYDSRHTAEKAGWHEYNLYADLHAGWHIKKIGLTPYVGAQYRWGWADMQYYGAGANVWKEYYQPENPWGMYVGADYYLNDKLCVNVQGNLIDQWGVDVGIGYLFDICGKTKPAATPPPAASAPVIEPKLEPMSKN